jgi:hypothetical protein
MVKDFLLGFFGRFSSLYSMAFSYHWDASPAYTGRGKNLGKWGKADVDFLCEEITVLYQLTTPPFLFLSKRYSLYSLLPLS